MDNAQGQQVEASQQTLLNNMQQCFRQAGINITIDRFFNKM